MLATVALPILDLAILVAYLIGVVLFGLWLGRRAHGLADYSVGGRDTAWWVVLLSIVATETSTVTFLSVPGVAWKADLRFLQLPLGYIVGRLIVVVLLLPQYFRGELYTAYEVLNRRFGGATKQAASVLFLVTRNLADGLRLFLTAIVLEEVTGIGLDQAVVCIGIATIVYTFVGGMRAVLWTDVLQFTVYMAGAAVAFALLLGDVGGLHTLLERAGEAGKLRVFDFSWAWNDAYVFWAAVIGGAFLTLATHGADQMMVQRYFCARSRAQAGVALGLSGVVVLLQFALFLLIGLALWAFYQDHPPSQAFVKSDRVFAHFMVSEMPTGVLGLLLGAVFSAAMSTLSSSLNSSATSAVHDLWKPLRRPDATPDEALRMTRRLTILFGVVQIAVGIGGRYVAGTVVDNVLAIAGFAVGILLGVFFLGTLTRRVQQTAALTGLVLGLALVTTLKFTTELAWPWFPLVGSLATFAFGYTIQLLLPARR